MLGCGLCSTQVGLVPVPSFSLMGGSWKLLGVSGFRPLGFTCAIFFCALGFAHQFSFEPVRGLVYVVLWLCSTVGLQFCLAGVLCSCPMGFLSASVVASFFLFAGWFLFSCRNVRLPDFSGFSIFGVAVSF